MATKKANNKMFQQVDKLKAQASNINDEAIQAADNLVDFSLTAGKQWQGLFAKALRNGASLLGKQQDMMLDTLESLKGHYLQGSDRMVNLLELNTPVQVLETPLIAKIKARRAAATKALKKATGTAKKATSTKKRKATSKTDSTKNDLRIIEGIGPKIESLFNEAGIFSFQQLASADLKTLRGILEAAGPRYKAHNPTTWQKQAKLAAAGKWDKLKQLQAELKGGRKAKK